MALVMCLATESGDQHNLFICNKCDPQCPLLAGQHRGKKRATDTLSLVSSTVQQGQSRSFVEEHKSSQPPICQFCKFLVWTFCHSVGRAPVTDSSSGNNPVSIVWGDRDDSPPCGVSRGGEGTKTGPSPPLPPIQQALGCSLLQDSHPCEAWI